MTFAAMVLVKSILHRSQSDVAEGWCGAATIGPQPVRGVDLSGAGGAVNREMNRRMRFVIAARMPELTVGARSEAVIAGAACSLWLGSLQFQKAVMRIPDEGRRVIGAIVPLLKHWRIGLPTGVYRAAGTYCRMWRLVLAGRRPRFAATPAAGKSQSGRRFNVHEASLGGHGASIAGKKRLHRAVLLALAAKLVRNVT